jgi:uncharacterized membrane protein YcgQ (UPF0703/DUF1980 family)
MTQKEIDFTGFSYMLEIIKKNKLLKIVRCGSILTNLERTT